MSGITDRDRSVRGGEKRRVKAILLYIIFIFGPFGRFTARVRFADGSTTRVHARRYEVKGSKWF